MERKDILKFKENLDDKNLYSRIHDFMDFVYINDLYEFTNNIYDNSSICEVVRNQLDNSGWEELKYMLNDIENMDSHYFYRDSNGNFRNITNQDINCIVEKMIKEIDFGNKESQLNKLEKAKFELLKDDSLILETTNKNNKDKGCASFSMVNETIFVYEGDSSGKDDKELSYDDFLNNYSFELKKELENSKEDYDL